MFALRSPFIGSPDLIKYIRDSTNESIKRKINLKKEDLKKEDSNINIKINTDLHGIPDLTVSRTYFMCTFFSIISFLAGYKYKSLQK
jgi:hypothetical protein